MQTKYKDVIVAAATPRGSGAIAIVRMSGAGAADIADKVFSSGEILPSAFNPRELYLGSFRGENFTERALCVVFRAPASYTGEDSVEFQLHGGEALTEAVVRELIRAGARAAEAGEFTRRAFLNGKTGLTEAEGAADMIYAESAAELNAASGLINSRLHEICMRVFDTLTAVAAELEVAIDYPEEDIEAATAESVRLRITDALAEIRALLATYAAGRFLKTGVNVTIAGRVNAGKSSLLNALAGKPRAIVTDIPGTTRDAVTETILIEGVKFNLTDTAGLRETSDVIENLGIDLAREAMRSADIILAVSEADGLEEDFSGFADKLIRVRNKTDLAPAPDGFVGVSAANNDVEALKAALYERAAQGGSNYSGVILTNSRHYGELTRALDALERAAGESDCELIATDVREAMNALGRLTGKTASESVLDEIFSRFCLGK